MASNNVCMHDHVGGKQHASLVPGRSGEPARRFVKSRGFACSGGHAGYEIAPFIPSLESLVVAALRAADPRVDLAGLLNTVRHHDMHHRWLTWLPPIPPSASAAHGYLAANACLHAGSMQGGFTIARPNVSKDAEGPGLAAGFPQDTSLFTSRTGTGGAAQSIQTTHHRCAWVHLVPHQLFACSTKSQQAFEVAVFMRCRSLHAPDQQLSLRCALILDVTCAFAGGQVREQQRARCMLGMWRTRRADRGCSQELPACATGGSLCCSMSPVFNARASVRFIWMVCVWHVTSLQHRAPADIACTGDQETRD